MRTCKSLLIFAICALFVTSLAWSQAAVNESLETATLWVDAVNGSDANSGTQSSPLQTIGAAISAAISNNQNSIGTAVMVQPGTYRESLFLAATSKDTSLPITIQAVTPSTVTVSGGIQSTGWVPYAANPAIYSNVWTNTWGLCQTNGAAQAPPFPDIVLRRETAFVNGVAMTQMLSLGSLMPGTFFVDEAGGTIYLYPPAGVSPTAADIELGTLPNLANITRPQVVLRGLNFQYANSCKDGSAITVQGLNTNNILLDTLSIAWNNSIGLNIMNPASNFSVINTIANHNGQAGIGAYQVKNGLWSNDTASYNNWRGAQGAIYNWNLGGFHPYQVHSSTINGLNLYYNQTYGAHWDTDHRNITSTSINAVNNLLVGDFYEKNEGPITISNSNYCGNNLATTSFSAAGSGMALRDTMNLTLDGNYYYNNAFAQISLIGTPGGVNCTPVAGPECVIDWETGVPYNLNNQNLTFTNNQFWAADATQYAFSDSLLGDENGFSDWTSFYTTYVGSGNTLWNPAATTAFQIPPTASNPASQALDLAGWQAATGQDSNAVFAPPPAPSAACAASLPAQPGSHQSLSAVPADVPDFWLIASNPSLALDNTGATTNSFAIQPVGNFPSDVTVTTDVSGAPGITATGSPTTVAGGIGTANLSYSAAIGTPAGTFQIPVMASGGGVVHTTTFYLTIPPGGARISTSNLSFPTQLANTTSAPMSAVLTNTGSTPISGFSVSAVTLSGNTAIFSQTNDCGAMLAGGTSCTLNVTFSPTYAGSYSGTLVINDSDPSSPQKVSLTGQGQALPQVHLGPSSLFFGNADVTTTSFPQTATFTNNSTTTIATIGSVVPGGDNASDFTVTNDCPANLSPGTFCTFTATFSPTAAGLRTASVTISDNSSTGTHTLSLQGTGVVPVPSVSLAPGNIGFGNVDLTANSATSTVTLTNTATDPLALLNLNSITMIGANPGDFNQTNNCPAQLGAGASCTFTLCFAPTASGSRAATLQISDNTNNGTHAVSLTGTGVVPVPIATLTPTSLPFGTVDVTLSSAPLVATLSNIATDPLAVLSISNITLNGANPGDYNYTTTCGATLAINSSCTFSIVFKPTTFGARPATLQVTDNTTSGLHSVSLTGTGFIPVPTATLSPSTFSFGNVDVTLSSAVMVTTLTNTATDPVAVLNISGITLTGANPGDYVQTNTCGVTLAASASCTISVTFKPTASGARPATLQVNSNTSSGVNNLTLNGTGLVPVPTVTLVPGTLNFGNIDVTLSSPVMTATLTNTATDALAVLNLSNVALTGANPGDYTYTTTCGATLAINATCTFTVNFKPTLAGTRSATLQFTDNTTAASHSVSLTGTGVSPTPIAKLSSTSLAFGNLNDGLTSTKTVTLTNSSADPLALMFLTSISKSTDTDNGEYTVTDNCPRSPSTLAAGGVCTITVVFAPTNLNATSVTVTITDNASPATQTITLTGTGTQPVPTASLTPATLAFASLNEGLTSTKTSVLKNTSTNSYATLSITSIVTTGTDAAEYTVTHNCPLAPNTLAAGASCTITSVFAPVNLDVTSVTVKITDNITAGFQNLTMTGTGTVPKATVTFLPAALTFASTKVGVTSAAQNATLTNTSTNPLATLAITNFTLTGNNPGDFASNSSACPSTLAPGASCIVSVTFTPIAKGTRKGNLNANDNGSTTKQTIALTGTGS